MSVVQFQFLVEPHLTIAHAPPADAASLVRKSGGGPGQHRDPDDA